jgi:uncharacterized protein YcfJ
MNKAIAIAVAGVLGAGAAVGAYRSGVIGPQYAQVVRATAVTVNEPVYADVLGVDPITQSREVSHQVCNQHQVHIRQPERFGNKDGALAGALIGGLLGNQIGKGDGRRAATVAGLVGGGIAGRAIDRRHVGGRITSETRQVCHTESRPRETTVGYNVRYQVDGQVMHQRMESRPSDQIRLGERERVIGYDVDWQYRDQTGTVRMDEKPGTRLKMRDGAVVVTDPPVTAGRG